MHGVSKKVTLPVTFLGQVKDPWGNTRAGFETETTLNRKDYGIVWNKALDSGGVHARRRRQGRHQPGDREEGRRGGREGQVSATRVSPASLSVLPFEASPPGPLSTSGEGDAQPDRP